MLVEYYFKIKYIKGIDNVKVNILNRKVELYVSRTLVAYTTGCADWAR